MVRVGCPDLLPVQAPAVLRAFGTRPHAREIGSGPGFAHADAKITFASADRRDMFFALLIGPIVKDERRGLAVCDPMGGDRRAAREQLLDHNETRERPPFL